MDEQRERNASPYLEPYRRAVASFGPTFEATLWHSREKQQARFRVIREMVDLTGRVVVDAGCGLGDLALSLDDAGVEYGRYVGLDAMDQVIDKARTLGLPEAVFLVRDFVGDRDALDVRETGSRADVVVFSGSLNTLSQVQACGVIARAWKLAGEAVVFNFLSARHGRPGAPDPSPAVRFDPVGLLDWALARTPRVRFRQDYLDGHDGTIAMFRGA